jgi:TolA-binding protein
MTRFESRVDTILLSVTIVVLLFFGEGCGASREQTVPEDVFFKPLRPGQRPARKQRVAVEPPPTQPAVVTSAPQSTTEQRPSMREVSTPLLPKSPTPDSARANSIEKKRDPVTVKEQPKQLALSGMKTVPGSTSSATKTPSQVTPAPLLSSRNDETVAEIERLYKSEEYGRTIDLCKTMLANRSGKGSEDILQFYLGASLYKMRRADAALASLKRVLEYPRSAMRPETLYIMGRIYVQMQMMARAHEVFMQGLKESPTSDIESALQAELRKLEPRK